MKLSQKQQIAQQILTHHEAFKVDRITIMYAPTPREFANQKLCIIVSVSKKISPTAVARNYNKRVLRSLIREAISTEKRTAYQWFIVCKEPTITKEQRARITEHLAKLINERDVPLQ